MNGFHSLHSPGDVTRPFTAPPLMACGTAAGDFSESSYRNRKTTSRIAQGWWPDPYRVAPEDSFAQNNNCEICNKPVTDGVADGSRQADDSFSDNNWIAMGPKGQRDVRGVANPETDPPQWWRFYHCKCVRVQSNHAPNHPQCTRPHGPCTDWHLRGKCKREFQCGHCHFHHPELLEKYPDLPQGGVLRRPQRRERLQMLKTAYEEDIKRFLNSEENIEEEYSDDEPTCIPCPKVEPQISSQSNRPSVSGSVPSSAGGASAGDLAQLLQPAKTSRVANALRTACAPGSEGYAAVKPMLEDKSLAPIVYRFVELLEVESTRRCTDQDIQAFVRDFLQHCKVIGAFAKREGDHPVASSVILLDIVREFCNLAPEMQVLQRRLRELARAKGGA